MTLVCSFRRTTFGAAEARRRRSSSGLDNPQEHLLAGLGRASRHVPAIEASLHKALPEGAESRTDEAHRFIKKDSALVLRAAGFGVLVPGVDAALKLRVRLGTAPVGPRQEGPAFGWDTLVDYDWEVALGDQTLSREEFLQLAALKQSLVQVRGQWVELDPSQIERTLAFPEKHRAGDGEMALTDALRVVPSPDGQSDLPATEVEAEGWIETPAARVEGRRTAPAHQGTARLHRQTAFVSAGGRCLARHARALRLRRVSSG